MCRWSNYVLVRNADLLLLITEIFLDEEEQWTKLKYIVDLSKEIWG